MSKFPIKNRFGLILLGFGFLLALSFLNMESFQITEENGPQQSSSPRPTKPSPEPYSSPTKNSSPDSYVPATDPDDLASSFLREASENFFYREFSKASENYHKAIAIYEERKDLVHVAKTYESLGDLYKMANEIEEAENNYALAAGYYSKIHNNWGETNSFKVIGDLYAKNKNFDAADKWYRKALAARGEQPHMVLGRVQEAMGQLYWSADRIPEAIKSFKQARETFASINYRLGYDHMTNVINRLKKNSGSIPDHATQFPQPGGERY